ncbi:hypothetical protein Q5H91_04055 [Sphingomonas sp. KR1UV-12]|uniref:Uncharacterized protein n=1 Tax=Sphingomonas aurea TaxID=3063994 RepID=A0ABT9EHR3_9SPHN|nr:hypothetical protein [Sphingomonas sp. KR1UV-12]MDP1026375.1 hypothetical protein [Sphingomonas sp. KR1UV-12]
MMATLPAVHAMDEAPGVVASAERVDAWLATAKPGDRFVYASRCSLPVASKGAARMRALQDSGLVFLHCPRDRENPTIFNYLAIRTARPRPAPQPERATLTARLVEADTALTDALLPVLQRAAHYGRPCPTDRVLAQRAAMTIDQVGEGLAALRQAGLIQITAPGSQSKRRVTIVATGQRTGAMA